jgi:FAD/FMN-containing dehydrogenase
MSMQDQVIYEVVESRTGWQLRRHGQATLVEFPSEQQAVGAAIAVCRDEGLARLVVLRAGGVVDEIDALGQPADAFAA